jgi:hypothetical protein
VRLSAWSYDQAHLHSSPKGRDRAHNHVSPGPNSSTIAYALRRGNIEESSALELTHADLVA